MTDGLDPATTPVVHEGGALQWFRRRFLAGFIVIVPLGVSVFVLVWLFRFVDGVAGPFYAQWLGREVPGLGIVTTVVLVLVVGVITTNVFGRRVLQRAESYLLRVPVFRTIYAPVRQLIVAFSPDNEYGFKRVVLVEDPVRGYVMGFLTKEFVLDRGQGPQKLLAVYVPTNHLYLGDVVIVPEERASFPDILVEEGIRVFLTGGMALPSRINAGGSAGRLGAPPRRGA
jgi:uncharacterized membrane protein